MRSLSQWCRRCGYSLLLTLALMTPVVAQQPITFQYFYDDLGQLVKVVDSTGTVIEYVYDAVGNILEIKRSTLTELAIFNFTPQSGPIGARVTIQGQGFSLTPTENTVQFNGVAATVTTATPTSLVVTVPLGATTGRIAVTVAGNTTTSDRDFTVLQVPVITFINPSLAFSGTTVIDTFQVTGVNLTGSTFAFLPAFVPPPVAVTSALIDPSGTSATLRVTIAAGTTGQFVLVAANATGSSDAFPSTSNTLSILSFTCAGDADCDGLSNAEEVLRGTDPLKPDTDGDGFLDGFEIALSSDPLNNATVPEIPSLGEAVGQTLAILNTTNPGQPLPSSEAFSLPLSLVNTLAPSQDSDHDGFSDVVELSAGTDPLDPTSVPNLPPLVHVAEGRILAILNTTSPSQPLPVSEAVGQVFSVGNLP